MPKQKTDDLIQLIKSLTRAEKRHFRLFVKRNQASDDILFLQLFDFLDKYKEYDEGLILKKLPGIKKRQLSNLKAHLYKQLLISLRLLNKSHNHDIEIREMIDYARVLYNKGLYRQSLDILSKTKNKALQTKSHTLAFEVLEFEKHIEGQYITRSIQGRAEELIDESTQLTEIIFKSNQFANLSLKLYSLFLKGGYVRNHQQYNFVKSFFYEHLPKIEYNELNFFEKVYYCRSFVWYYHITQNFLMWYRYARKWVDLFHKEEEMKIYYPPLYLKGLNNLLNALFNVLSYQKFIVVLEELNAFPEKYDISQVKNVESLYYLFKYTHTVKKHFLEGTFTEGTKVIPEIVEIIESETCTWDDHRVMIFYYSIACLYFGSGDNGNAIHFLNLIINQKNPDYREDIQCFARILNLIAHFELGNAQLVEYQVKSVYRFLLKMEELHEVHREVFRFLRRTPIMRESELKSEFIKLRDKLIVLEDEPFEKRPFLYLDIISWLESKIEDRPVQDIIREKFIQRLKEKLHSEKTR